MASTLDTLGEWIRAQKIRDWVREKAGELGEMAAGAPGTPYGEVMNSVMAAGRSIRGGTYDEELQKVREAREQQYPGAYSEIPAVREPALDAATRDFMVSQAPGMAAPITVPALRRALTARTAELADNPPTDLAGFVPMAEFQKRYISQYSKAKGTNSRFDKSAETLPSGTWVIDDMNGIHGREIGYVADVDPNLLKPSEDLPERLGDAARYAEWNREGHRPPPVTAMETDKGSYVLSDGHRRRIAALRSGSTVPAVIWPTGPHPKGLIAAGETEPMRVGLTFEMLQELLKGK